MHNTNKLRYKITSTNKQKVQDNIQHQQTEETLNINK